MTPDDRERLAARLTEVRTRMANRTPRETRDAILRLTQQETPGSAAMAFVLLAHARLEDDAFVGAQILEGKWTEDEHQERLLRWAGETAALLPALLLLFHVPNGAATTAVTTRDGRRVSLEGARMKRLGVRVGVPDLVLPVPRGPFSACFLELKRIGETVRPEQRAWIVNLRTNGNCADVRRGWRAARLFLLEYLTGLEPSVECRAKGRS